jgi:hypothetical protein
MFTSQQMAMAQMPTRDASIVLSIEHPVQWLRSCIITGKQAESLATTTGSQQEVLIDLARKACADENFEATKANVQAVLNAWLFSAFKAGITDEQFNPDMPEVGGKATTHSWFMILPSSDKEVTDNQYVDEDGYRWQGAGKFSVARTRISAVAEAGKLALIGTPILNDKGKETGKNHTLLSLYTGTLKKDPVADINGMVEKLKDAISNLPENADLSKLSAYAILTARSLELSKADAKAEVAQLLKNAA